jgi:hypothetical protein
MNRPARARLPGRWPAGLIGMLALVAAVERYVARHDTKFTTQHAAAWRRSGQRVKVAARCAVVAFGDSLVKHGVVPAVVEARTGRPAYNLAVPGGRFPGHYFLLRRVLRAGGRPSAVLVDGEMIGDDPLDTERLWPELATPADCAELARACRDAAFGGRLAAAQALPSFRARTEVRLSITAALGGTLPPEPQALALLWRNWNTNAGAQVLSPRDDPPGVDPRPAELERSGYRPTEWKCHPVNADYARRFLDLAAAHGVPVFWLLPPYHPEVEARRQQYGWYGQYADYLHGLTARYPNLVVVDGRRAGYPPEVLADMTHLSRAGAIAFSDAVGRVLADRLVSGQGGAGAQWVALPRFETAGPGAAAVASTAGVEDMTESARALERLAAEAEARHVARKLAHENNRQRRRR